MECTQKLYQTEKTHPDQIGFLAICGDTYPINLGPNKIGRDPTACSIYLNLNSISRQHAVINIENKKIGMLIDLGSSNKTKLNSRTIPPYIPQPLKDGDLVHFGDILGIYRLLEQENDLPMTQVFNVPETPEASRHVSRLNQGVTIVPESPEVGDKDDSFIQPSQPKEKDEFKSPQNKFLKPSGRTISIQPIGSNKIDNVFWDSSKKSTSLSLNDSTVILNNTAYPAEKNQTNETIHQMDTQALNHNPHDESNDSIFTAVTQVPNRGSPSIHIMETQIPDLHTLNTQSPNFQNQNTEPPSTHKQNYHISTVYNEDTQLPTVHNNNTQMLSLHHQETQMPAIYNRDTQDPSVSNLKTQTPSINNMETGMRNENLSVVKTINDQEKLQITENKENELSIFNAETQADTVAKDQNEILESRYKLPSEEEVLKENNSSDPKDQSRFSDEEINFNEINSQLQNEFEDEFQSQALLSESVLNNLNKDPNITLPTKLEAQIVSPIKKNVSSAKVTKNEIIFESDESTDCEDIDNLPTQKLILDNKVTDNNITDCQDKTESNELASKNSLTGNDSPDIDFENMTQMPEEDLLIAYKLQPETTAHKSQIEDLPTQKLDDYTDTGVEDLPTQRLDDLIQENNNSTSTPVPSNEIISPFKIPLQSVIKIKRKDIPKLQSTKSQTPKQSKIPAIIIDDDNFYESTQQLLADLCTQKEPSDANDSIPCSVEDDKVGNVKDVIGIQSNIAPLKKAPSDHSDIEENTPKKHGPYDKVFQMDFPNSQEIKISTFFPDKTSVSESSSESENDSEETDTPVVYRKNKKPKINAKIDLTKKFDDAALPTRVITRVRKPTAKLQNSDDHTKKVNKSILKSKLLTEQEGDIDPEFITENISRLRSRHEKNIKEKDNKNERNNKKDKSTKESSKHTENIELNRSVKSRSSRLKDRDKLETKIIETKTETKNCKVNETTEEPSNRVRSVRSCRIRKQEERKRVKNSESPEHDVGTKSERKQRTNKKPKTSKAESPKASIGRITRQRTMKEFIDADINVKQILGRSSSNRSKNPVLSEQSSIQELLVPEVDLNKPETSKSSSKKSVPPKQTMREFNNLVDSKKSTQNRSVSKKSVPTERSTVNKSKDQEVCVNNIKSICRRGRKNSVLLEDKSAVYNISSESGAETPVSLKRSATIKVEEPFVKRTRSTNSSHANNSTMRSTPAKLEKSHRVLFTTVSEEGLKEFGLKLKNLGAEVVTDVLECTVLVTLEIKRTCKLLCAVGLGRPIVGLSWVMACVTSNTLVDPWLYLIEDEEAEKRFNFSLKRVLTDNRKILKGYNISSTPSVHPKSAELKLIVECSGGNWKEGGSNWICITNNLDLKLWPSLKAKGATLVKNEFILGGVLRKRLDIDGNKLGT